MALISRLKERGTTAEWWKTFSFRFPTVVPLYTYTLTRARAVFPSNRLVYSAKVTSHFASVPARPSQRRRSVMIYGPNFIPSLFLRVFFFYPESDCNRALPSLLRSRTSYILLSRVYSRNLCWFHASLNIYIYVLYTHTHATGTTPEQPNGPARPSRSHTRVRRYYYGA